MVPSAALDLSFQVEFGTSRKGVGMSDHDKDALPKNAAEKQAQRDAIQSANKETDWDEHERASAAARRLEKKYGLGQKDKK